MLTIMPELGHNHVDTMNVEFWPSELEGIILVADNIEFVTIHFNRELKGINIPENKVAVVFNS